MSAACICWLDASRLHGTIPLTHYRSRDCTPTTAGRQSAQSAAPPKPIPPPLVLSASGAPETKSTACGPRPFLIVGSTPQGPIRHRCSLRRREGAANEGRLSAHAKAWRIETLRSRLPTLNQSDGNVGDSCAIPATTHTVPARNEDTRSMHGATLVPALLTGAPPAATSAEAC